jgi:type I restriction enzyme S subunit
MGKEVLPEYFAAFCQSDIYWRQVNREMRGSAQGGVNSTLLGSLVIPLPDLAEQKRIAAILERADRLRRLRRYGLEMAETVLAHAFRKMFVANGKDFPIQTIDDLLPDRRGAIRTGPFGSQLLHSEFVDSGIAVLGIDNVVANRFQWDERRFITPEKYADLKRYTVLPGDVLISIMGTCGRCAIVPDNLPRAINTKHLCCITLDQSKCLPTFLHASFLHHPAILKKLGVAEKGAIMPGLNMEIIKDVPIPLPPLEAQRQFALIVKRTERFTDIHRESLRQAEHLFQTLLHRAFTSGV